MAKNFLNNKEKQIFWSKILKIDKWYNFGPASIQLDPGSVRVKSWKFRDGTLEVRLSQNGFSVMRVGSDTFGYPIFQKSLQN